MNFYSAAINILVAFAIMGEGGCYKATNRFRPSTSLPSLVRNLRRRLFSHIAGLGFAVQIRIRFSTSTARDLSFRAKTCSSCCSAAWAQAGTYSHSGDLPRTIPDLALCAATAREEEVPPYRAPTIAHEGGGDPVVTPPPARCDCGTSQAR